MRPRIVEVEAQRADPAFPTADTGSADPPCRSSRLYRVVDAGTARPRDRRTEIVGAGTVDTGDHRAVQHHHDRDRPQDHRYHRCADAGEGIRSATATREPLLRSDISDGDRGPAGQLRSVGWWPVCGQMVADQLRRAGAVGQCRIAHPAGRQRSGVTRRSRWRWFTALTAVDPGSSEVLGATAAERTDGAFVVGTDPQPEHRSNVIAESAPVADTARTSTLDQAGISFCQTVPVTSFAPRQQLSIGGAQARGAVRGDHQVPDCRPRRRFSWPPPAGPLPPMTASVANAVVVIARHLCFRQRCQPAAHPATTGHGRRWIVASGQPPPAAQR